MASYALHLVFALHCSILCTSAWRQGGTHREPFFHSAVAGLIGSRLGQSFPIGVISLTTSEIFSRAGMASHGAILAVMTIGYFYVRKHKLNYWQIADFAAPILPADIFIRLGNFQR